MNWLSLPTTLLHVCELLSVRHSEIKINPNQTKPNMRGRQTNKCDYLTLFAMSLTFIANITLPGKIKTCLHIAMPRDPKWNVSLHVWIVFNETYIASCVVLGVDAFSSEIILLLFFMSVVIAAVFQDITSDSICHSNAVLLNIHLYAPVTGLLDVRFSFSSVFDIFQSWEPCCLSAGGLTGVICASLRSHSAQSLMVWVVPWLKLSAAGILFFLFLGSKWNQCWPGSKITCQVMSHVKFFAAEFHFSVFL